MNAIRPLALLTILLFLGEGATGILSTTCSIDNHQNLTSFHEAPFETKEGISHNGQNSFIENYGQIENDAVRFYSSHSMTWFTDEGIWFKLNDPESNTSCILKQEYINCNNAIPYGNQNTDENHNFIVGQNTYLWTVNVPSYNEIIYRDIWDNIDLKYYFLDSSLKYDLILKPGARPDDIKIRCLGADEMVIKECSSLYIQTAAGFLMDRDLYIYQTVDDDLIEVSGRFVIVGNNEFSFEILEPYNDLYPLIIDPYISYSTYLGGNHHEETGTDLEIDGDGNIIVCGYTLSTDFPTTPGAYQESDLGDYDGYITKMTPDLSTIIFSTYIGGTDSSDSINEIFVDGDGYIYACGNTNSIDFPTTSGVIDTDHNGGADAIVLKLDPTGSDLTFSTYFGGTESDNDAIFHVDPNGDIYLSGRTYSQDLPVTIGAYEMVKTGSDLDLFIAKIINEGTQVDYCTYIDGVSDDQPFSMVTDQQDNCWIVGWTYSSDFPVTSGSYDTSHNGDYDGFILRMNALGSDLELSTFLGSNARDGAFDILIGEDQEGPLVVGRSAGSGFPTTPGSYDSTKNGNGNDVFITQFDDDCSEIIYSTFFGGLDIDDVETISKDRDGHIILTGMTSSQDFPVTENAFDDQYGGSSEFFISVFSNDCKELLHSTYIGGDNGETGGRSAYSDNHVYIIGRTQSQDYPTTKNAYDRTMSDIRDVCITAYRFLGEFIPNNVRLTIDDTPIDVIYPMFKPYTIEFDVINTGTRFDTEQISLSLNPLGSNVTIVWNQLNGSYSELIDDEGAIHSIYDVMVYNETLYKSSYSFPLLFSWDINDEDLNGIRIEFQGNLSETNASLVELSIPIRKKLEFSGEIIISDNEGQVYSDGAIVRGGMNLTWSGPTIRYDGAEIGPAGSSFNVSLSDGAGGYWLASPSQNEPVDLMFTTPDFTSSDPIEYSMNVIEVPESIAPQVITHHLKTDMDTPYFSDPIPPSDIWQTENAVSISIKVSDIGGGSVDGDSIFFSTSYDNGTSWGMWEKVYGPSDQDLIISTVATFAEGRNNLIKWKSSDSVGNGPVESDVQRVIVDTEPVVFSNATPRFGLSSIVKEVNFGITVFDQVSGVDPESIQYSISYDGGITWTDWTMTIPSREKNNFIISAQLDFPNGTENRIKWRASDIAGNGPVESDEVPVIVDIFRPKVNPSSPLNRSMINTDSIKLIWVPNRSNNNWTYTILCDTKGPPVTQIAGGTNEPRVKVDDLKCNTTYYWTVRIRDDDSMQEYSNNIWTFSTDRSVGMAVFSFSIMADDVISVTCGETTQTDLIVTNTGKKPDSYLITSISDELVDYVIISFDDRISVEVNESIIVPLIITCNKNTPLGSYEIEVSVISLKSDENCTVVSERIYITLEVKEERKDMTPEAGSSLWPIILLALVIIIVLLFSSLVFVLKHRKRKEGSIQESDHGSLVESEILQTPSEQGRTDRANINYSINLTEAKQYSHASNDINLDKKGSAPGSAGPSQENVPLLPQKAESLVHQEQSDQ